MTEETAPIDTKVEVCREVREHRHPSSHAKETTGLHVNIQPNITEVPVLMAG